MPQICWANSSVFAIQPFRMQIISSLIRCKNNEIHRNIHLDRFAQCIHQKVFEKFIQPLSSCASHKLVNLMVGNSIHMYVNCDLRQLQTEIQKYLFVQCIEIISSLNVVSRNFSNLVHKAFDEHMEFRRKMQEINPPHACKRSEQTQMKSNR